MGSGARSGASLRVNLATAFAALAAIAAADALTCALVVAGVFAAGRALPSCVVVRVVFGFISTGFLCLRGLGLSGPLPRGY